MQAITSQLSVERYSTEAHTVEEASIIVVECEKEEAGNVNLHILLSYLRCFFRMSEDLKESVDADQHKGYWHQKYQKYQSTPVQIHGTHVNVSGSVGL